MSWNDDGEVEDVWTIVRERDGLRLRVKALQREVARLSAILASSGERVQLKPDDRRTPNPRTQRRVKA